MAAVLCSPRAKLAISAAERKQFHRFPQPTDDAEPLRASPLQNRLPFFAKNGSHDPRFSQGFLITPPFHPTALPFFAKNGNRMESTVCLHLQ
jgi:hypothetical protein